MTENGKPPARAVFTLLLLPGLAFLLLHVRSLPYEFVWVDDAEIVQGALIRAPGGILQAFGEPLFTSLGGAESGAAQAFYRPLQVAVVSTIHSVAGNRPAPYRAVSLAIGVLSLWLFTALAWLLFERRVGKAVFAGSVAALHPAGLEVYVWIAGISEALVDLFVLLVVLCTWIALGADRRRRHLQWTTTGAIAFVLALLSKENAVIAPALLAALGASLVCARRSQDARSWQVRERRVARVLLPAVAVQSLLALLFLAWWRPRVLGGFVGGAAWIGDTPFVQWMSAIASWPMQMLWLAVPLQSSSNDTIRVVTSAADAGLWLGLLLVLVSLGAWILLLRRGRPVAAFGLAWVWLAFLPAAGLIPALHPRAERYLHLSLFGWALFLADLAPMLLASSRVSMRRGVATGLAVLVVAGLAQRTWERTPAWRSTRALFERDVARNPEYREGRYNLAVVAYQAGDWRRAEELVTPLVRPDEASAATAGFLDEGSAATIYCMTQLARGLPTEALVFTDDLARRRPSLADRPGARFCRARALEETGATRAALSVYLEIEEVVGTTDVHVQLAIARCHARLGEHAEARRRLETLDPSVLRAPGRQAEVREIERLLNRPRAREPRSRGIPSN